MLTGAIPFEVGTTWEALKTIGDTLTSIFFPPGTSFLAMNAKAKMVAVRPMGMKKLLAQLDALEKLDLDSHEARPKGFKQAAIAGIAETLLPTLIQIFLKWLARK